MMLRRDFLKSIATAAAAAAAGLPVIEFGGRRFSEETPYTFDGARVYQIGLSGRMRNDEIIYEGASTILALSGWATIDGNRHLMPWYSDDDLANVYVRSGQLRTMARAAFVGGECKFTVLFAAS